MKQIQLTITALSPLAIGRKKPGGSVSEAGDYIPGSVIRGAMASQMIQQSNLDHPDLTATNNDF
ncbi:MAG: CRISPR-associated RAMP protein Csx10, partial [Coleofasciculus sp.]